ncbi:MAG: NDP-sugar synthase [Bdellovibrionaceae bacterium]|nr:NDP-sugar synthase [Pseudobdellovibrionaceae bacterium]
MNVMMLTAGEGTRLRPHTQFTPKPAIPFLNVPLYAYPLFFLNEIKLKKVVLNTFHLSSKLKMAVNSFKYDFPIHFSDEQTLLGSGGGVEHAKRYFQSEGDFILMNGDEVIIPTQPDFMESALKRHRASGSIATLLVMEHLDVGTKFGGVWVDQENKILGFGKERHPSAKKGYHYIGVAIISEKIFNFIQPGESNILYDGLTQAIQGGHWAQVVPISCLWFETGNETDFKSATQQCLSTLAQNTFEGNYLKRLIQWRAPDTQFTHTNDRFILADKKLNCDFAAMSGYNVIGADVFLKKGCRLKNCILGPHVQIKHADQLENMMIINDQDVF